MCRDVPDVQLPEHLPATRSSVALYEVALCFQAPDAQKPKTICRHPLVSTFQWRCFPSPKADTGSQFLKQAHLRCRSCTMKRTSLTGSLLVQDHDVPASWLHFAVGCRCVPRVHCRSSAQRFATMQGPLKRRSRDLAGSVIQSLFQ